MNKRVTLTDREIWHIVESLKAVQEQCSFSYQVVMAGRQALQDIIDKLEEPTDGFELQEDGTVTSAP